MPDEHLDGSERERRFNEILVECLEAADQDENADPLLLVSRYPEFAIELALFFKRQAQVDRWAAPLRDVTRSQADQSTGLEAAATSTGETDRHQRLKWQGDFELLAEIGRGGMGVVYKARQRSLNRLVALKMVRGDHSPAEIRRFQNEAEMLADLEHPNIVSVYDVGENDGQLYFSMKLIEGGNLASWITEHRSPLLDLPRALQQDMARLVCRIAVAVHYAHQRGILHRDLKPSNILLQSVPPQSCPNRLDSTIPHVTDFGLAKRVASGSELTLSGDIVGTPSYMAPEQASGLSETITTATDVYGLGAILYSLLTGHAPFPGKTALESLVLLRETEPVRPSLRNRGVDPELETICLKCLEKKTESRYGSAALLAEDLQRWLADEPIQARRSSRSERVWRWVRRNPSETALMGSVALFLLVLVIGLPMGLLLMEERNAALASLTRAETAEAGERIARKKADVAAHLANAQAIRWSGQVGQRHNSLAELKAAARLSPSLQLRNEAIACLSLSDLKRVHSWKGLEADTTALAIDGQLRHYARSDGHGNVAIRTITGDREIKTLPGPDTHAWILRFSPDGRYLAATYHPNTLFRLWDWATGQIVFETHTRGHLDFSPDSRSIAVDDQHQGGVAVYATDTGKIARRFDGRPGQAQFVSFHPDGKLIAVSARNSESVRIISVESGKEVELVPVTSPASCLAWRPDGQCLAIGCKDQRVLVARPFERTTQAVLVGHNQPVERCVFLLGGDLIATWGWDGTVRFWEPLTGTQLLGKSFPSNLFYFSQHDSQIGFVNGTQVELWEATSGRAIRQTIQPPLGSSTPHDFEFSPDSRFVAFANNQGVSVWDWRQGLKVAALPIGFAEFRFDPAGKTLYTYGRQGLESRSVTVENGRPLAMRFGPPSRISEPSSYARMTMDSSGRIIALVESPLKPGVVLNPADKTDRLELGAHPNIGGIVLSPDGKWVVTSSAKSELGSRVKVWNSVTGALVRELYEDRGDGYAFVTFSPDSRCVVTAWQEKYRFWKVGSWEPGLMIESAGAGACAFSPKGDLLALVPNPNTILLLNASTKEELARFTLPLPQRVFAVCFDKTGTRLAARCAPQAVHVWDLLHMREQLTNLDLDWDHSR